MVVTKRAPRQHLGRRERPPRDAPRPRPADRDAAAPGLPPRLGGLRARAVAARPLPDLRGVARPGGDPRPRRRAASPVRALWRRLGDRVAPLPLLWQARPRAARVPRIRGPPRAREDRRLRQLPRVLKTITTFDPIRPEEVVLQDLATAALDVAAVERGYRPPDPRGPLVVRIVAPPSGLRGLVAGGVSGREQADEGE